MENVPELRGYAQTLLSQAELANMPAAAKHEALTRAVATMTSVEGAVAQEEATKRLATLTTWLVIATFVLAASTVALVVATVSAK